MAENEPRISIIAALSSRTRAIGAQGELLWPLPKDLKRFKELTAGHPVIMGRKTFESILRILGKPLPNRSNIVVTRRSDYSPPGIDTAGSLEIGLEKARARDQEEIFIIGGQQIYEQSLALADRLYLTLVESDRNGDTWFPPYEDIFSHEVTRETQNENGLSYTWVTLERK